MTNLIKRLVLCLAMMVGLALALVLCGTAMAAETAPAAPRTESARSGGLDRAPLTRGEIRALLESAPLEGGDGAFDEEPSLSPPYSPGKVKDSALRAALDRLNALRALAGLPPVELDAALCENAQYGAMAMAYLGTITHYPAQGGTAGKFSQLPENVRTEAAAAARTSNLSAGRSLTGAMDGFMNDNSGTNIEALGHRRWQLNPGMGKTGFGYAASTSGYRRYVVEKAFDESGKGRVDYDFVAWPASGNFPNNLEAFTRTSAWSVTLNPAKYAAPDIRSVTVTLTGGGNTWTFRQGAADGYFNVEKSGYGVSNCIIFLPGGSGERFSGDYTVTIAGLKDRSGAAASLRYTVSFFDAGAAAPRHTLRVTNGHTDSGIYQFEEGDRVALTADPPAPGTVFRGWTGGGSFQDSAAGSTVFTMPGHDAEAAADFSWPQGDGVLRIAARWKDGRLVQAAAGETDRVSFGGMTLTAGDRIFVLDAGTLKPLSEPIEIP